MTDRLRKRVLELGAKPSSAQPERLHPGYVTP